MEITETSQGELARERQLNPASTSATLKIEGEVVDLAKMRLTKVVFRLLEPEALADFLQVEKPRLAPQAHFCQARLLKIPMLQDL